MILDVVVASLLAATPRIDIQLPHAAAPIDGRLVIVLTKDGESEPRLQVHDGPNCPQVFGSDVDSAAPGSTVSIGSGVMGYPIADLSNLPAGDYFVQAVLHVYDTFHRADGHVVKLPMDHGEGQQWNRAPGDPYSTARKIHFDPKASEPISLVLDLVVPPIPPEPDTKYVKHVRIRSELLSKFWGRDMYLGASVLLPFEFEEHPSSHYPLLLFHGHFESGFGEFRETPPDPTLKPDYNDRFRLRGYNRIQQEQSYELFKTWTSPQFPRYLVVKVQHANPYYDDSYAVNSANLGPYGDAIQHELLPAIENRFRGIGEGWARFTCGGSTGGWEALAVQLFYPDDFNGCFAACPDPIDFRAYTVINIYEAVNAYYTEGDFHRIPQPAMRDFMNRTTSTVEAANHLELVLGTHSRSGQQFDIWEAVYGPLGEDGYPARIFDKETGVIDHGVANYWRDHFDLRAILERDWSTLGPKLQGKLHIYCGTMDNYFLDNAVAMMDEYLKSTTNPHSDAFVDFGLRAEHCWNGDHTRPNAISRLRYPVMYADLMLARMTQSAPRGADLTSWRY